MPRSRGGANDWSNKVRACRRCNHAKGCMTEAEFRSVMFDERLMKQGRRLANQWVDQLRDARHAGRACGKDASLHPTQTK